jgi:hypothetical protein
MARASHPPTGLSLLTLGQIFLRIGATAFGGLGAALALAERELVTKRQWLTATDMTEALTYTKLLPGSTVVQVVSYLGYELGGWSGSAVATAAFVFPSALLMLVLAAAYVSVTAAGNGLPAGQSQYPRSHHPGHCACLHCGRCRPGHQRGSDCRGCRSGGNWSLCSPAS